MKKRRVVYTNPPQKNYFLVDACFLSNKYLPLSVAPDAEQLSRLRACHEWWQEIDRQIHRGKARIYIPDICIAEAFKVLAKKYYQEKWIKKPVHYSLIRKRLQADVSTPAVELKRCKRKIKFHDISTTRDMIISVDRFFEFFMKHGHHVQIADLIIVATAKYLMDFFDISRKNLHIITMDRALWEGAKKLPELPNVYDPTDPKDSAVKVFRHMAEPLF